MVHCRRPIIIGKLVTAECLNASYNTNAVPLCVILNPMLMKPGPTTCRRLNINLIRPSLQGLSRRNDSQSALGILPLSLLIAAYLANKTRSNGTCLLANLDAEEASEARNETLGPLT